MPSPSLGRTGLDASTQTPKPGTQPRERGVIEIRVHGVGGAAPGAICSDTDRPVDVIKISGDSQTAWYQAKDNPRRFAYQWSGLTTTSRFQAVWVLLLPFTLLNVARWMSRPDDDAPHRRATQISDIALAVVAVTATINWVLWLWLATFSGMVSRADLSATLTTQHRLLAAAGSVPLTFIAARFLMYDTTRRRRWARAGLTSIAMAGLIYRCTRDGTLAVVVAGAVVGSILTLLIGVARRSHGTPLASPIAPESLARGSRTDREIADSGHRWSWLAAVHLAALLGTFVFSTSVASRWRTGTAPFDGPILVVGAVQFGTLMSLLIVDAWRLRWDRSNDVVGPVFPTSSTAFLASLALNGFMAGMALQVIGGGRLARPYMGAFGLLDVFAAGFIATALALVAWLLAALGRPGDHEAAVLERMCDAPASVIARTRRSVRLGTFIRHLDAPLALGAWLLTLEFILAFFARWDPANPWTLSVPQGWLTQWSGYFLTAVFFLTTLLFIFTTISSKLRRLLGHLWDIGGCFERRIHPLGMRPYVERTFPELARVQLDAIAADRTVIWYGHSQGSVLVYGALSPERGALATEDGAGTFAVVSAGSPLRQLYARYFPRLDSAGDLSAINERWWGGRRGWWNWFRYTDPIAGPVLSASGEDPGDRVLDDPVYDSGTGQWSMRGHSDYHIDPQIIELIDGLTQSAIAQRAS